MEIFDSILGNASEAAWESRLEGAHIDWLELSQWDAQKSRFRKKTAGGRTMAVALERGHSLRDGDILDWDEEENRAVVCRIRLCPVMMLDLSALSSLPVEEMLASAVSLGHALGNQHWPAVVRGSSVFVPVATDKNVVASVMDTHAVPGVSYVFLSGEDVLDLLDDNEARRLFGGAEQGGHSHVHEPLLSHDFGREHGHHGHQHHSCGGRRKL
jgi:urease accessory protein